MNTFSGNMKNIEAMTDLELIDFYIDECHTFIDPRIFRHIQGRGLTSIIDTGKTASRKEMKAIARARLHSSGRYTGDAEIERIAAVIHRIKTTQLEISHLDPTDAITMKKLCGRMEALSSQLLEFYQ